MSNNQCLNCNGEGGFYTPTSGTKCMACNGTGTQLTKAPLFTTTHGMARTPLYKVWSEMKRRCKNPNDPKYKYYGARGISVCASWDSFENFYRDMGERPTPKHSIDRINNDGNYEPENCRWATALEQRHNQRKSGTV